MGKRTDTRENEQTLGKTNRHSGKRSHSGKPTDTRESEQTLVEDKPRRQHMCKEHTKQEGEERAQYGEIRDTQWKHAEHKEDTQNTGKTRGTQGRHAEHSGNTRNTRKTRRTQ